MYTAKFIDEIKITDPDTKLPVEVAIFKDLSSGALFGIDASYIDQEDIDEIQSPFNPEITLTLTF